MYHTPRAKWQLRLSNLAFVLLFLVAIGLLQWASREFHWQFDVTQNRRYALSPASVAAVEGLKGPVTATAYASERGNTRQSVREIIGRYQQYKPDLKLEFINPDTEPERVRSAGVRYDGEMVLA